MLDQRELDWFVAMNRGLHDELSSPALAARLRDNIALMHRLAAAIGRRAGRLCRGLDPAVSSGGSASPEPSLFPLAA